jgi:hypothetical protein
MEHPMSWLRDCAETATTAAAFQSAAYENEMAKKRGDFCDLYRVSRHALMWRCETSLAFYYFRLFTDFHRWLRATSRRNQKQKTGAIGRPFEHYKWCHSC